MGTRRPYLRGNGKERRVSAARRESRRHATGRFATRSELTRHVWAMRRGQVYPNLQAIAVECGTSMRVVKAIATTGEGLDDYLERGCPTG